MERYLLILNWGKSTRPSLHFTTQLSGRGRGRSDIFYRVISRGFNATSGEPPPSGPLLARRVLAPAEITGVSPRLRGRQANMVLVLVTSELLHIRGSGGDYDPLQIRSTSEVSKIS